MVVVVYVAVMQPPGTVPIDGRRCVYVAVMQPPGTVPIDLNSYRTRKYASMHGKGNRTGL